MNILHIAPYYPSLNAVHAGGRAMGKEIETLEMLNHSVVKLSFVQKKYDYDLYSKEHTERDECVNLSLKRKIKNILCNLQIPVYFATRKDREFYKKMCMLIEKNEIDAIHAEYSSMLLYVKKIKKKYPKIKFVCVLHDVTVQSYLRKEISETNYLKKIIYKMEALRIRKFENKLLRECDEVLTFSDKDQKLLHNIYQISSRCINTYFDLDNTLKIKKNITREEDGFFSICFLGQMGRTENTEAAIRLINIVRKINFDNKRLYIIGANPPKSLLEYSSEKVIITGYIEDVDKFIKEKCDIACFPLINGAGIKIKVLECMALGIPVITNEIGAEGIDESGQVILLAESNEEFEKLIHPYSNEKGIKCSDYINQRFGWEKTVQVLENIYRG